MDAVQYQVQHQAEKMSNISPKIRNLKHERSQITNRIKELKETKFKNTGFWIQDSESEENLRQREFYLMQLDLNDKKRNQVKTLVRMRATTRGQRSGPKIKEAGGRTVSRRPKSWPAEANSHKLRDPQPEPKM